MAFLPLLGLVVLFLNVNPELTHADDLQTYIVHVSHPAGKILSEDEDIHSWYQSFLPDSTQTSENQQRMLYAYQTVMTGFAARLTPEEVAAMEKKEGFVLARPEKMYHLQTTHSPQFLGLPQQPGSSMGLNLGKGVIIGVLDSGIFPDHPSFSDVGMPPPPAKWKGRCDFKPFQCNNKLIGSRAFNSSSPIDDVGHGTMTASIVAGAFVQHADLLGSARGTAVGTAPKSHLAMYKVCHRTSCSSGDVLAGLDAVSDGGCHQTRCSSADILAGLDAAISDGVDVLSISIGSDESGSSPFFEEPVAVGTFAAIQKGIFVSCAAGNSGPSRSTLFNDAPWMLTVGASSIDRNIVATVKLGDGIKHDGESLFQPPFPSTLLPLAYPGREHDQCGPDAFKNLDVERKIVLCRGIEGQDGWQGQTVKEAGGAAMILMNEEVDGSTIIEEVHVLPTSKVSYLIGERIIAYINSTKNPTASIIFKGTVTGNPTAPAVTSSSSRGPSLASPGILKPDIIGPGLNILAASPLLQRRGEKPELLFNIESGTSFSCPHLSGIAALVKRAHPHWTPAAVKSAIMTSAGQLNLGKGPILDETLRAADVFAIGAGHVNPRKAIHPGLVHDIQPDDYIPYLCGLGYTDEQVSIIAHKPIKCSGVSSIPGGQLNYPSFSVVLGPPQTFTRTVTNVGKASSSYVVTVVPPQGVSIRVKPAQLSFSEVHQKATYSVTFRRVNSTYEAGKYTQGYLKWVSGKYLVRSPISVKLD